LDLALRQTIRARERLQRVTNPRLVGLGEPPRYNLIVYAPPHQTFTR